MSFLYPQFLYALGLLALPVIIHFFNFRRYKKVEFTNVNLLEKAQNVKRSINKLRNWLVLLFRLLAITALVLAFAQPVSDEFLNTKGKATSVSVYVDNSSSTLLKNQEGSVFELEKKKADQIANVFGKEEDYMLFNNVLLGQSRFLNKADFLERNINQELSPVVKTLPELWEMYSEARKDFNSDINHLYLISDFQKNTTKLSQLKLDSQTRVHLVPVQASNTGNLSIDSVWMDVPAVKLGDILTLKAIVNNRSEKSFDQVSIQLFCNGKQRAIADFSALANAAKEVEMSFKTSEIGWNSVELRIDDYPVDFDNQYFLAFNIKKDIKVLSIDFGKPSPYLKTAFATDEVFVFEQKNLSSIDYGELSNYDLVILNGIEKPNSGLVLQLQELLVAGSNIFIIPGEQVDLAAFNSAFASLGYSIGAKMDESLRVSQLAKDAPFMENIFQEKPSNRGLPNVLKHYSISSKMPDYTHLMTFGNGKPFLSMAQIKAGYCFIMSSNLSKEWTDFGANSPFFVPFLYKMALHKTSGEILGNFIDNNSILIPVSLGNNEVLNFKNKTLSFIPRQQALGLGVRVFLDEEFKQSGFYQVTSSIYPDSTLAVVGLNYSRQESDMQFLTTEELQNWATNNNADLINASGDNFKTAVIESNEQNLWWKWLLYATLLFVLLEILTIKLFGYASRS